MKREMYRVNDAGDGQEDTIFTRARIGRCVLAGVGFLADAYDLFVINIVKNVLKDQYNKGKSDDQTKYDESLIASAALWGAVAGQLLFGGFADYLGRRNIFVTTLALTTLGSLASAFCQNRPGSSFGIYQQLALCRFVLGFGVGGEYPLSATVTSESASPVLKGRMMATVFSMQGLGNIMASLLMFILLSAGVDNELVWRLGLGFGAVPGILAFYFRWTMGETDAFEKVKESRSSHSTALKVALKVYWKPLIGTAVSWFLLDVTFYGNGLFSGTISELMNLGSGPTANAKNALFCALMALPGYYLSVAFIDRIGRKRLQFMGFGVISILYFVLGGLFDQLSGIKALFLILYGLTFLFSNFGPNATTYIIPGEFYPAEVRATCHGISAASGKIGAALTANTFLHIKTAIGLPHLLMLCGGIGAFGMVWTWLFVPDYSVTELGDVRETMRDEYHRQLAQADEKSPLLKSRKNLNS